MKDCTNCGMNYEPKEYDNCPYCGHIEEAETVAETKKKSVKEEAKKEVKKEVKEVKKEVKKEVRKEKPAREEKLKPAVSRLTYILIGVAVVVIAAIALSAIFIGNGSGVTVPGRYPTIQAAIDAAEDGDEIVVDLGIYRENIDFKGKNIILRSTDPDDPAVVSNTIIDGGGNGIVVSFRSGENEGALLSGFTVTRGSGIVVSGYSSPVIEKCLIEDNNAEYGAGIYVVNSSPTIRENMIIGNSGSIGGGIFIEESSPWVEGNTIARNRANMGSGIAVIYDSSPTIINNTIADNTAANVGGGVLVAVGSKPIIKENTIINNTADRNGGGLYIDESEPELENNAIARNRAANGGGIFIVNALNGFLLITGNNIADNLAFIAGGGIFMQGSAPVVEENTFINNISENLGGAVAVYVSSPAFFRNTFENNQAKDTGRGGAIWYSTDSVLELSDPDDNTYLSNLPDNLFRE